MTIDTEGRLALDLHTINATVRGTLQAGVVKSVTEGFSESERRSFEVIAEANAAVSFVLLVEAISGETDSELRDELDLKLLAAPIRAVISYFIVNGALPPAVDEVDPDSVIKAAEGLLLVLKNEEESEVFYA